MGCSILSDLHVCVTETHHMQTARAETISFLFLGEAKFLTLDLCMFVNIFGLRIMFE